MSDEEITMASIVATLFFGGNLERACVLMKKHGYYGPKILEKSRFNRFQHQTICLLGKDYLI